MNVLHSRPQWLTAERLEVHVVFAVAFFVFLPVVVIRRLVSRRLRLRGADDGKRLSIIGEARALTETYMPFAFM